MANFAGVDGVQQARQEPASLARSNAQYAQLAARYDALTPRLEPIRREAHAALGLRPGDSVIDVGCGTGKSLSALANAVGAGGHVVGLEPCVPMFEQACARIATADAPATVRVFASGIEAIASLVPPRSVDAFLFMFTHDVLQSDAAISALLRVARPGARFALAGGKFFSGPLALLNPWVQWRQRPYCTTFANYDAPWRSLFAAPGMSDRQVAARYGGIAYIASATWRGEPNAETECPTPT